ncbi:MAG: hypothetical protein E6R03_07885 [Hyphomicrobiaceae bacterium]|nr:MAG: hypothetical protein E6R03_07885 [Hyphomicrobiaceae bacterium]
MFDTYHLTTVVDNSETTRLKEENARLRQTLQSVRAENNNLWAGNNSLRETIRTIVGAMSRSDCFLGFYIRDIELRAATGGDKVFALLKSGCEENLKRKLESAPPTSTMPA